MIISEKSRYLVVPTSASAEKTKVYLKSGEKLLTDLDARVDFANPETVFYYDISRFEERASVSARESLLCRRIL